MQSLSATLTAAQKAESPGKPHIKLWVGSDVWGTFTRFHWTRYYEGSEEDYFHAVAMPSNGSLFRMRVTSAAGAVYRQLVTSPDADSTYSSWTDWSKDAYAVAACASGVNIWAFCIDKSDGHLYRSDSTDSGASFGAWTDMGDVLGDDGFRLAAAAKSTTEAIILYSGGVSISRRRLSSGTWEAASAWSNTLNTVTGLAVHYSTLHWNVLVTGTEETTLKPGVWHCALDSEDAWSSLIELTIAEAASNVIFKFPGLYNIDYLRGFFVEKYTDSEAYTRPYFSHGTSGDLVVDQKWREPVPFNLSSEYGLDICYDGTNAWLTRPDGVWSAPESVRTASLLDIASDVLRIETEHGESEGSITVTLRNDDGRFNSVGAADDTYELVKRGAQLNLYWGLTTSQGDESSGGWFNYTITGWAYTSYPGHAEFILYAADGWTLLNRWVARRQYKWDVNTDTAKTILEWILTRAGFAVYSVGATSTGITNLKPAFTINTGETGKTAVLRLLAMVEEVMRFSDDNAVPRYPQAADAADYSYGTDHSIYEAWYTKQTEVPNRVQVFGNEPTDIFTEDFDWTEIDLVDDVIHQDIDESLTSTTRAHERGEAVLAEVEMRSLTGYIRVPMNCGQEIYDQIAITDSRVGYSAEKKRVMGMSHVYDTAEGRYDLTIYFQGATNRRSLPTDITRRLLPEISEEEARNRYLRRQKMERYGYGGGRIGSRWPEENVAVREPRRYSGGWY